MIMIVMIIMTSVVHGCVHQLKFQIFIYFFFHCVSCSMSTQLLRSNPGYR